MANPKPPILPDHEWQALVIQYDRLAHKETHRAMALFPSAEYDDLLMEARLALTKAARAYNPHRLSPKTNKPVQFSTLAVISIRNHISGLRSRGLQQKRYGYTRSLSFQDLTELLDYRSDVHPDDRDEMEVMRDMIQSDVLEPNERRVIQMLSKGCAVKHIARTLKTSPAMVAELRAAAIVKLREAFGQEADDRADGQDAE